MPSKRGRKDEGGGRKIGNETAERVATPRMGSQCMEFRGALRRVVVIFATDERGCIQMKNTDEREGFDAKTQSRKEAQRKDWPLCASLRFNSFSESVFIRVHLWLFELPQFFRERPRGVISFSQRGLKDAPRSDGSSRAHFAGYAIGGSLISCNKTSAIALYSV